MKQGRECERNAWTLKQDLGPCTLLMNEKYAVRPTSPHPVQGVLTQLTIKLTNYNLRITYSFSSNSGTKALDYFSTIIDTEHDLLAPLQIIMTLLEWSLESQQRMRILSRNSISTNQSTVYKEIQEISYC